MPNNDILGGSFTIDVTNLKAGLAQANRLIRESESEFKAAAAGMDDWTESSAGLEARLAHLNKTQTLQEKKVDALEKAYKEAGYAVDDMSIAAVTLRTDLNKEKAALAKTKKEIKAQEAALEELANAAEDAGDGVKDAGKKVEEAGDGFTVAKGAVANFIADGLSALVGACKNAISSIAGLAEETREYREDMGKLETAFEAAGLSTDMATDAYKELYSVLGEEDRSVEALNHLAKFVETEEDMARWTDICAGVWGTFGDSLPIEGLTEAANETAKSGKLTGVLVDSLVWAGIEEEAFQEKLDACTTEQERAALITDTLNGLYGEAAEKYKENNESVIEARKANSDYTDSMAALGEKVEPVTTIVREGFNKILEKVLELTEGVDIEGFGESVAGAFDTFVNDIMPKIVDGMGWMKENLPTIATLIGGVTTAIVAQNAATKIKTVMDAAAAKGMTLMTYAQQALNAAMKANLIGIIITAVSALVAAFIYLWNNCEGFREFWINLWENIKETVAGIGEWFGEVFRGAWEAITNAFANVGSFFGGLWDTIVSKFSEIGSKVAEAIGGAFKSAINSVISVVEGAINFIPNAINGALSLINALPGVNIPMMPTISLPRLAMGGIVDSATAAIIGENGREAVMPLENNTGWIKDLAKQIVAETGGGGVTVNQTNNYSQAHSRYEIYKSKEATARAVRLAMQGV